MYVDYRLAMIIRYFSISSVQKRGEIISIER